MGQPRERDTLSEPALSAEAWVDVKAGNGIPYAYGSSILDDITYLEGRDIPAAIAYLNHELPDSDLRKILALDVEQLRIVAEELRASDPDNVGRTMSARASLTRLADALEAYLPPP